MPLAMPLAMLLANAIGSALIYAGILVSLLSLVVAVVIESLLLRWWWGRRGVWRWVLVANVASLVGGVLPVMLWHVIPRPGDHVDPWEWYQTVWIRVLLYCAGLFVITVVIEGLVYSGLHRWAKVKRHARRIVLATVVVNLISYAPMVGLIVDDSRHTGSFTFSSDTAWLGSDDRRAYFVDPESKRLHSIRLDGSDRRLERDVVLGRVETDVEETAFYCLLVDDPRILYAGPDGHWYVHDGAAGQRLNALLPENHSLRYISLLPDSLREALVEAGIEVFPDIGRSGLVGGAAEASAGGVHVPPVYDGQVYRGVYLSSTARFDWEDEPVFVNSCRVHHGVSPYPGIGHGLVFEGDGEGQSLKFAVWAGFVSLACNTPMGFSDENTVVFRCGRCVMVADLARRRVGRLVAGDSLLVIR